MTDSYKILTPQLFFGFLGTPALSSAAPTAGAASAADCSGRENPLLDAICMPLPSCEVHFDNPSIAATTAVVTV